MIHLVLPEAVPYQRTLCQTLSDDFEGAVVAWFATDRTPQPLASDENFRRAFLSKVGYKTLFRALKADKQAILIVGGWSSAMALKTLLIAGALRVPFFIWADHPHPRRRNLVGDRLRKTYLRMLAGRAKGILACGRPTVEHLAALGIPRAKLFNFPYWTKLPETWSLPSGALNKEAHAGPLRLITIGRLVPVKSFETAIKAVALANAKAAEPACELVIVGDGPERQRLAGVAFSSGLQNSVSFTGWLDSHSVSATLQQSDVLMATSRFEAYSVVVLEALAHGRPVLASEGVTGAIDRNDGLGAVIFHSVGDAHQLSDQIGGLARDREDLRRRAEAARINAEQWPPARAAKMLRDVMTQTTAGRTAQFSDYKGVAELRPGSHP